MVETQPSDGIVIAKSNSKDASGNAADRKSAAIARKKERESRRKERESRKKDRESRKEKKDRHTTAGVGTDDDPNNNLPVTARDTDGGHLPPPSPKGGDVTTSMALGHVSSNRPGPDGGAGKYNRVQANNMPAFLAPADEQHGSHPRASGGNSAQLLHSHGGHAQVAHAQHQQHRPNSYRTNQPLMMQNPAFAPMGGAHGGHNQMGPFNPFMAQAYAYKSPTNAAAAPAQGFGQQPMTAEALGTA